MLYELVQLLHLAVQVVQALPLRVGQPLDRVVGVDTTPTARPLDHVAHSRSTPVADTHEVEAFLHAGHADAGLSLRVVLYAGAGVTLGLIAIAPGLGLWLQRYKTLSWRRYAGRRRQ
jgi:hypothetical protein